MKFWKTMFWFLVTTIGIFLVTASLTGLWFAVAVRVFEMI